MRRRGRLAILPDMPAKPDHLPICIEEWTPDGERLVETLVRCINVPIARAAFPACVGMRPRGRIMIRHGTRVVQDSGEER